jgi:high-affinity nickel permease
MGLFDSVSVSVQFIPRGHERMTKVGPIIQTLTLATILLIIGLVCTLIGMSGLIWKAGYDRRQAENADKALTSGELEEATLRQSAA